MKTKLIFFGLLLAAGALFTACEDDDGGGNPNENKEKMLLAKYPQAQNISWAKSKDNKYDIATFILLQTRATNADTVQVWFGQNDNIRLVNQEITFDLLPMAVQSSFAKTKCNPVKGEVDNSLLNTLYSNQQIWEAEDIYKLERDGAVSYKIEMEAIQLECEINLYYDEQGILLKEVTEDEEELPLEIPEDVRKWITTNYKDAEILDYEMEEEEGITEYELDLKQGKVIIEITLNQKLEVMDEEYNYPDMGALPQDIQTKARELLSTLTGIAEEDITEIEMEKEADGSEVFTIELEKGDREVTIEIIKDSQGVVSGEVLGEEEED